MKSEEVKSKSTNLCRDLSILAERGGFSTLANEQSTGLFSQTLCSLRSQSLEDDSNPPYIQNKKESTMLCIILSFLAERGGFEPPMGFKPIHDFQSCALDQLSHLSKRRVYYNQLASKNQELILLFITFLSSYSAICLYY